MSGFKPGPECPTYRHGMTGTPEHNTWQSMLQRCTNQRLASWHRYGGRGIRVCERWQVFENFLADMGKRPSEMHSLDRIDNDGDYEPGNCRWATSEVQNANKSTNVHIELDGRRQTLAQWAREIGITVQALTFRLNSTEWTLRDALTIHGRRHVRGERHKLAKLTDEQAEEEFRRRVAGEKLTVLAEEFGVSISRISKLTLARLRRAA